MSEFVLALGGFLGTRFFYDNCLRDNPTSFCNRPQCKGTTEVGACLSLMNWRKAMLSLVWRQPFQIYFWAPPPDQKKVLATF